MRSRVTGADVQRRHDVANVLSRRPAPRLLLALLRCSPLRGCAPRNRRHDAHGSGKPGFGDEQGRTLGANPPELQLAVSRDLPLGREGSTPSPIMRNRQVPERRLAVTCDYFAEREGFEPSVRLPVHMISSHAPSATRSPLLSRGEPSGIAAGCRFARRPVEVEVLSEAFALVASSRQRRVAGATQRRERDSNPRYPHGYT
jgi:hypothetical protein